MLAWLLSDLAVNLRHPNLIGWTTHRGLFARADRAAPWGNLLVLGRDGDRASVIAQVRRRPPARRPDLLARLGSCAGGRWGAGARRGRAARMC
jgi:hypothetical protein